MRKEITLAEISLRPGGAIDDLNEADFGELFNELPEEPEVDLDEAWIEEQIEISKMLRKEGKVSKMKPKCKLSGTDGNVFALTGLARKALVKAGMVNESKEMTEKIFKAVGERMKRLLIVVSMTVCLLVPRVASAQADITNWKPERKVDITNWKTEKADLNIPTQKKVIDKTFIAVGAYLVLMSIFDTETTFAVVHNGGHETNPIMKPIIKSGRPATYGVMLGTDALFMFIAYEMKKSSNPTFNKTWWVVPMVAGTAHGVCGGLNLRYVH